MKYTYEFHEAADRNRAYYEYTDELGRKLRHWELPGSGTHLYGVEEGQATCDAQEWYDALPIGQRTSVWLSDARTVLSRAETALAYPEKRRPAHLTAEETDIIESLEAVVRELSWVAKTGKTPKYPGGSK